MNITPEQKKAILSDKSLMRDIIAEYLKIKVARDNMIRFMVTDAERAYIQAQAEVKNQNLSEYIRSLIFIQ